MPTDSHSGFPITDEALPPPSAASVSTTVRPSPDPDNPPWGLGGALLLWLASVALILFFPLAFFLLYSVQRGLSPGQPDYIQKLAELATDKTALFLQVLSIMPAHILTFAMVWLFVTRKGKLPFRAALGWGWPKGLPKGLGLPLSVVVAILLFGLASVVGQLLGADKTTTLDQLINSSLAARYTIAVLAVLSAPFVEEFVYRGVLYGALHKLIGPVGSSVVVLGLFTFVHVPQYWPNFGVIGAIGVLSVALTIIRAYTGRLLPCIVIHLVFNGITSIYLLLEPYIKQSDPSRNPVNFILQQVVLPVIQ